MISLSQQSCAKVTRSFSPLSQRNSKPSEHQRRLLSATATRPLWARLRQGSAGLRSRSRLCVHNAIHPLCINHRQAVPLRLPSQQRHTAITIRRQVSHRHVYPGQYGGIVRTGLPSAILSVRWPVNPNAQLRTRHAKTSANVAYSSFPGNEGACAIHFFARPNSTASLSISASIVFLPRRRWSSRICLLAAASSEAGTTSSPDATAVSEPS